MRRLLLAALLAWGCSPVRLAARAESARTRRRGLAEATISLNGMALHVWKGGQGPPLLLLHGFGGDGLWTWRSQIEALAAHHTLFIPDLLWFGGSDAPGPYTLDRQTDAVIALLDHEGIARTDVVGISYGGFVTLSLGVRAPERVGRAVLVDSPGAAFSAEDYQGLLNRFGATSAADVFVPTGPEGVRTLLDLAMVKPPRVPKPILRDLYRQTFSQHQPEQRALLDDLLGRRDSTPVWKPTGPVLLVWGAEDGVFPVSVAHRLAETLAAPLVVIPDTAHAPNLEAPAAFNAAILNFLDGGSAIGSSTSPR